MKFEIKMRPLESPNGRVGGGRRFPGLLLQQNSGADGGNGGEQKKDDAPKTPGRSREELEKLAEDLRSPKEKADEEKRRKESQPPAQNPTGSTGGPTYDQGPKRPEPGSRKKKKKELGERGKPNVSSPWDEFDRGPQGYH